MAEDIDTQEQKQIVKLQPGVAEIQERIKTFREHSEFALARRWVNNPIYEPSELTRNVPLPPNIGQFTTVIHNAVFEGSPPKETGYVKVLEKERNWRFGRYTAVIEVLRRPLIENPTTAEDYLYMVIPHSMHPSIFTGLLDRDGEKVYTAFISRADETIGFWDVKNMGIATEEELGEVISGFTKPTTALEAPKEEKSPSPAIKVLPKP